MKNKYLNLIVEGNLKEAMEEMLKENIGLDEKTILINSLARLNDIYKIHRLNTQNHEVINNEINKIRQTIIELVNSKFGFVESTNTPIKDKKESTTGNINNHGSVKNQISISENQGTININ